jgi:hypothetical protein
VTNLAVIFRRRPDARARLSTAYFTAQSLGGVGHRRPARHRQVVTTHSKKSLLSLNGQHPIVVGGTSGIGFAVAAQGPFDHLVYTAGEALLPGPLSTLSAEQARAFFETRYWGALWPAKHAAAQLRPGGTIGTILTSDAGTVLV